VEKQEPMQQESVFPGLKRRDSNPLATPKNGSSENTPTTSSYFNLSSLPESKDASDISAEQPEITVVDPITSPLTETPETASTVKSGDKQDLPPPLAPVKKRTVHPDIVARAFIDTTLVVIPAEAFKKLVEKFPHAGIYLF
jgi:hypothetical protein